MESQLTTAETDIGDYETRFDSTQEQVESHPGSIEYGKLDSFPIIVLIAELIQFGLKPMLPQRQGNAN